MGLVPAPVHAISGVPHRQDRATRRRSAADLPLVYSDPPNAVDLYVVSPTVCLALAR